MNRLNKKTAFNGRFCEMAAVTPQKRQCELGSYYPAGSSVKPLPRKAAGTLYAILGQCVGQERFTINSDEITKNLKNPKTKQFAKFVLWCELRSHHKTNPRQKWLRHIWLCPPTTQNKRIPQ